MSEPLSGHFRLRRAWEPIKYLYLPDNPYFPDVNCSTQRKGPVTDKTQLKCLYFHPIETAQSCHYDEDLLLKLHFPKLSILKSRRNSLVSTESHPGRCLELCCQLEGNRITGHGFHNRSIGPGDGVQ